MHETIKRMANAFAKQRTQRRRAYALFTALALVVSMMTTYLLVQPASTMEVETTICDLEEHVHGEQCYQLQAVCGMEEREEEDPGHSHAECLSHVEAKLICTITEQEAHTHGDACYGLTCGKQETDGHAHGEECYVDETVLTCTVPVGHAHSASCYGTEEVLTCTLEEGSGGHAHSEACLDADGAQVCGMAEGEGAHAHGAACYSSVATEEIVCGQEEMEVHEHSSEECYGAEKKLACTKAEEAAHAHDENCSGLICTLIEGDGHAHDADACYVDETIYDCGEEEREAVPAHAHTEECWKLVLVCTMVEHVHDEACHMVEQGDLMMILPEGAEIPEGYTVEYTHIDSAGHFDVAVYTLEGTFPEGAELAVELLTEDSAAYAQTGKALDEMVARDELRYDQFVALDIHFELDGEEIEPASPVFVYISIEGLLPEEVDTDSVKALHLKEQSEQAEEIAVPEIEYVEVVADNTELTGIVETTENDAEAAADVKSFFALDSFSVVAFAYELRAADQAEGDYFQTRWTAANPDRIANVYYVGVYDGEIFPLSYSKIDNLPHSATYENGVGIVNIPVPDSGTQDLPENDYAAFRTGSVSLANPEDAELYVIGSYNGTYVTNADVTNPFNGGSTKVRDISYNNGWHYDNGTEWKAGIPGVSNSDEVVNVYLVYDLTPYTTPDIIENPVHENINVTLYDYGSLINNQNAVGAYPVLDFFASPGGTGGNVPQHTQVDGYGDRHENESELRRPVMLRTLNAAGYPEVVAFLNGTNGGVPAYDLTEGSIQYLFHDNEATPYEPLKYGEDYTWSRGDDRTNNGYKSDFASKRYTMAGDGGLFQIDEDGYFNYDSAINAAYFNGERFELYDAVIAPGFNTSVIDNFYPFNQPRYIPGVTNELGETNGKPIFYTGFSTTQANEEVTNNWFGMTMEYDFLMPKDGLINEDKMVFEFHGDDDVWVYIDDVLILDIGGIHAARRGTIDFATGEVVHPRERDSNAMVTTNLRDQYIAAYKEMAANNDPRVAGLTRDQYLEKNGFVKTASGEYSKTFGDYSTHHLNFYYMERGGNISYCKLRFNMPTLPMNSLTVEKQVEDLKDSDRTYSFQILDAGGNVAMTDKAYDVYEGEQLVVEGVDVPDNGIITFEAGQQIRFSDIPANAGKFSLRELIPVDIDIMLEDVTVNGVAPIEGTVEIDGVKYMAYRRPPKDVDGDSALYFLYVNDFKAGSLEIGKTVVRTDGSDDVSGEFDFSVQLDGVGLAEGTTYQVLEKNTGGEWVPVETKKVEAKTYGEATLYVITLSHNQKAVFSDIPAGTEVTVTELTTDGYAVKWTVSGTETHNATATGQISPGETTELMCTNTTGAMLPSTGGIGTTLYTVLGGLMMACAAGLLELQRRRRSIVD